MTNDRLKQAVRSQVAPPFLEARIRNSIRSTETRPAWSRWLVPVAASAAVCVGAVIAYELGHLRFTAASQESYITSVTNRVGTLMRVALGDHIHCSVFRKYPKNPPTVQEFTEKLGPEFSGLLPIVRRQVPEEYTMTIAHECRYRGRKFIHLSLKSDSRLLSLSITKKNEGESFETENVVKALSQSGISFYRAGAQKYEVTAFETRDYLIYFVTDFPREQSMEMMLALAPQVKEFLHKIEL